MYLNILKAESGVSVLVNESPVVAASSATKSGASFLGLVQLTVQSAKLQIIHPIFLAENLISMQGWFAAVPALNHCVQKGSGCL